MGYRDFRFLDVWARMYRNARGLGAVLAIFAAMAVLGVLQCREASDPVVESRHEVGLLVATAKGAGEAVIMGTIALDTGDTVEVWLAAPYPEPGQRVPLQVDVKRSGKRVYWFDADGWLSGQ